METIKRLAAECIIVLAIAVAILSIQLIRTSVQLHQARTTERHQSQSYKTLLSTACKAGWTNYYYCPANGVAAVTTP